MKETEEEKMSEMKLSIIDTNKLEKILTEHIVCYQHVSYVGLQILVENIINDINQNTRAAEPKQEGEGIKRGQEAIMLWEEFEKLPHDAIKVFEWFMQAKDRIGFVIDKIPALASAPTEDNSVRRIK